MQKMVNLCIAGGVAFLIAAVIVRLGDMEIFFAHPVRALWKVSITLLLLAIAIGVNRK